MSGAPLFTLVIFMKVDNITLMMFVLNFVLFLNLLTLNAHAREGYSSHFVCHSVCVSLFDFGEGAVFRVETYIDTF